MKRHGRRPGRPEFTPGTRDEVDEELAFHVEERIRYYRERGLDEDAACRAALERLGDLGSVREECMEEVRSARRVSAFRRWLGDLRQDVTFGLRSAARVPALTVMAVATLALGTGANGAVFDVVRSVLLDALPFEDDGRLVRVYERSVDDPSERAAFSSGAAVDYQERQRSFVQLAAFRPAVWDAVYRTDGGARVLDAAFVEPGFFETLGVGAAQGRLFTRPEIEDNTFVVVVSDELLRRDLGADPGVIGRPIRVDSDTWQIIGVLPPGFIGPMGRADLWFGIAPRRVLAPGAAASQSRWLGMVGRLRPGLTIEDSRRDLAGIAGELAREHPVSEAGRTVVAMSLRDAMIGDTRMALLALMGSAALVLLIACANLAGALLARALTRRREFAIRAAIGAGRGRLMRQLLAEAMLLAVAGAACGLAVAWSGLRGVQRLAPAALPVWTDFSLDPGTAVAMAVAAVVTGLLIGLSPALAVRGSSAAPTLRDGTRATGGPRSVGARGVLVAAQVALCLSLLTGASLLTRSLLAMIRAAPGYDPAGVLTVAVKGPVPAPDEARRQFFDRLKERAGSLPGVISVATTSDLPGPATTPIDVAVERASGSSARLSAALPAATVSDEYFRTMRIPLLSGRTFGPQDNPDAPPAVIVSETMALRFWPDGSALGGRLRIGADSTRPAALIVGIAGDVRNDITVDAVQPMLYTTDRQSSLRGIRTYIVRTAVDPATLVGPFRRELAALDPGVPMDDVTTLRDHRSRQLGPRRLPAVMLTAFSVLALLLASIGVYALFAALAAAREREFGVRLALGSSPGRIGTLVLRQAGAWLLAGLVAGAIGAVAIAHALRSLLFGIAPLDPLSLAVALTFLLACGITAMLIPIRRATRLDPRRILG